MRKHGADAGAGGGVDQWVQTRPADLLKASAPHCSDSSQDERTMSQLCRFSKPTKQPNKFSPICDAQCWANNTTLHVLAQ